MKLNTFLLALVFLLSNCSTTKTASDNPPPPPPLEIEKNEAKSTLKEEPILVGNDVDQSGCKKSAGFSWSKLKKECIRPWTNGIKLSSIKESSFHAMLFFNEGKELAEIFLKEENESILLKKDNLSTYHYLDYKLVFENNRWSLLKNQLLIYSSL